MGDSPLPTPHARKHMIGPNLVVVYEPESISDLALIWNLRAAHGLPPGLPLAVPATNSILRDLRDLLVVQPQAHFGIGGDRAPRLISTSVAQQTLEEIAAETRPFVAGDWREFREIPLRPGRTRRELVRFAEGRARMSSWAPQDRIQLGLRQPHARRPDLKLTVSPVTQPLPFNTSLRPEWAHQDGWRDWGYQTDDRGPDDLVTVCWPSGWAVVQALLKDRGLRAEPSTSGRVAASLLTRLGSFHQLGMLLDTQVLAQIYDLGTAKAMTWFRKRARDIAQAARRPSEDETAIQAIERTLSQMTLRPDDEEQPLATVETVRKLFANDRQAARAWIRWAEASDLLVRGARVKCSDCFAESWRQMGELAPPVTCRGCGKTIDHPYPEGELKFFYRASEPLLRAVDQDVLSHLLALRFFCELWQPKFNQPSALYGGYPGVDIYEIGSGTRLGEADVLLVMSNGDLIPGECKRTGTGLNSTEIGKLDELGQRLGSPWSFVATMDWAADCSALWSESLRFAPDLHPRFALTAEHLFTPHVFWPGGSNIFEWNPADAAAREVHHTQFVQTVPHWSQIARG